MTWLELLIPALVLMAGLPCAAIAYVYSRSSSAAWRRSLLAFFSASAGISFLMAIGIFFRISGLVEGFLSFFAVWNISFALCATASYHAIAVALIAAGSGWKGGRRLLFGTATVLAYAATLGLALRGERDLFFPYIEGIFSATSLYLFSALALSLAVLLRNRARLRPEDGRTLDRFLRLLLPLVALVLVDELLRITRWIDIPALPLIPLSPLALYCFAAAEILGRMRLERDRRMRVGGPLGGSARGEIGSPRGDASVQEMAAAIAESCDASPLTLREREILVELFTGLGNPDISAKLGISPHTVKNHVYNIYQKTGAGSRKELFAFAVRSMRDRAERKTVARDIAGWDSAGRNNGSGE